MIVFVFLAFFLTFQAFSLEKGLSGQEKQTLILSQESFLKQILDTSPQAKKLKFAIEKSKAQVLEKKYLLSEGGLFASWNTKHESNPPAEKFFSGKKDTLGKSLSLNKKIPYGINLDASYFDNEEENLVDENLRQLRSKNIYRKGFNFQFKSNLTEMLAHFWLLQSFNSTLSLQDLVYYEELEQLMLSALAQYWKSYLAYIKLQQAQASLETYKKLVREINKKKKYRFLQPGERPQILAEYQNIQSALEQSEQAYEQEKTSLFLYLEKASKNYQLDFDRESFKNPQKIGEFKKVSIEKTRAFQIKKQALEIKKLDLSSQKSSLYPQVELFGKKGWKVAEEQPELKFSSDFGFYEFGLSLNWMLFSKSAYQKIDQKKYELQESEIDFEIAKKELKNQFFLQEEKIKMALRNINRTKKVNEYRKKSFQELRVSFNQGRVETFQLVRAEKELRDSEIQKVMALSEYHLSLASFLALRDELIEKQLIL